MPKFLGVMSIALLLLSASAGAQEQKVPADTLVIQADGSYEADPDLATLAFHVSVQEKEFRRAYDRAAQALQRILQLAERNGIAKQDISTGSFTMLPMYDSDDRKRRTRAYRVENHVTLKIRDFAKIGPLLDEAVQDEITDFRSLDYSLSDEEGAKQKAVADAMHRAEARARAAFAGNGRKVGAVRYVSLDVKQPLRFLRLDTLNAAMVQTVEVFSESEGIGTGRGRQLASLPVPSPGKITVNATVQCVFQIQ